MAVMSFMPTTTIKNAFDYLEGDVDSNNKTRCHKPKPVHGDRESLEKIDRLAKDLGIKNTHSSLTISFDKNDIAVPSTNASQEELDNFYKKYESFIKTEIENFRDQWFPGMKEGENFADYWNIHTDKGRLELNCVFVKMELTTGKQFNPFPPGQLNIDMRDHYIDLLNDRNGFDRKISNPFAIHHNDLELKEVGNETEFTLNQKNVVKPKKDDIQNYLSKKILDEKINNRKELIQELQKYGEVKFLDKENSLPDPKTGKHSYDYISFIPEGFDKPIRLDGPAFKKNVDFNELREEFHQHHQKDEKTNEYKLVNLELTDKERVDKKKKLENHRDYELKKNMKLMSKPKSSNKNRSRVYLSKSQKNNKSSKKLQEFNKKRDGIEKSNSLGVGKNGEQGNRIIEEDQSKSFNKEEKKSLKNDESHAKQEGKNQIKNENVEPIIIKNSDNKESKSESFKPSISAFSQVATSSNASLLTVQINQVLFSKLSLELQIGSLSIYKESDIRKIFELKQKIAELEQQIATLKAKQEQAIEAELINQNANRFKNSSSSMKFRV